MGCRRAPGKIHNQSDTFVEDNQHAFASQRALALFSKNVLWHFVVQGQISIHVLELPVFFLQLFDPLEFIHLHAPIPGLLDFQL